MREKEKGRERERRGGGYLALGFKILRVMLREQSQKRNGKRKEKLIERHVETLTVIEMTC